MQYDKDKLKYHDYTIKLFDELESTNTYALNNFDNKLVIICEKQTNGRGRFERSWTSSNNDITLSICYALSTDYNIGLMPLIISIAINRLLKNYNIANKIKWPNDIYCKQNKIAGVLLETRIQSNQCKLVIGIGLDNIKNLDKAKLAVNLIEQIDNIKSEFELFGFELIRREWLDNCIHNNKTLQIYQNDTLINTGKHIDISSIGELIIKNKENIIKYNSSNISLKGFLE